MTATTQTRYQWNNAHTLNKSLNNNFCIRPDSEDDDDEVDEADETEVRKRHVPTESDDDMLARRKFSGAALERIVESYGSVLQKN